MNMGGFGIISIAAGAGWLLVAAVAGACGADRFAGAAATFGLLLAGLGCAAVLLGLAADLLRAYADRRWWARRRSRQRSITQVLG